MFSHMVKALEVERRWGSCRGLSFPFLTNRHWDSQGWDDIGVERKASYWAKHKPCSSQESAAVRHWVNAQRHFLSAVSTRAEWVTSMQQILLRLLSILYSSVVKQICQFGVHINRDLYNLAPHGSPGPATASGENEAVPSPASNIWL